MFFFFLNKIFICFSRLRAYCSQFGFFFPCISIYFLVLLHYSYICLYASNVLFFVLLSCLNLDTNLLSVLHLYNVKILGKSLTVYSAIFMCPFYIQCSSLFLNYLKKKNQLLSFT